MTDLPSLMNALDESGYAVVPDVLPPDAVADLRDALTAIDDGDAVRLRNERVYAVRNLMSLSPDVRRLCDRPELRSIVEPIVGCEARVVRAILFDKSAEANWKVAWHQDLSIAVRERIDVAGFGPWSIKAGVAHVQPPAALLERMLTVRLHLDDCDASNGPLRVLPGSHRQGVLSPAALDDWRRRPEVRCVAPAGGAVLMRPLLLHASSTATSPLRRRVVHLEWSADDLPGGLQWHQQ